MRASHSLAALVIAACTCGAAILSGQSQPSGPTFDVVSIKRNTTCQTGRFVTPTRIDRPDGGFTYTSIPVMTLVARAYPMDVPADIVGLPDWARRDYYDVSATSTLTKATPEDRIAMLRAMLADRCKLVVHVEKREQPVYELLLARGDGRLGSGMPRLLRVQRLRTSRHRLRRVRERRISRGVCLKSRAR
ncbi:MAG TPA: TIGR03435 family protein [Vicinamibacterales bacterium]